MVVKHIKLNAKTLNNTVQDNTDVMKTINIKLPTFKRRMLFEKKISKERLRENYFLHLFEGIKMRYNKEYNAIILYKRKRYVSIDCDEEIKQMWVSDKFIWLKLEPWFDDGGQYHTVSVFLNEMFKKYFNVTGFEVLCQTHEE